VTDRDRVELFLLRDFARSAGWEFHTYGDLSIPKHGNPPSWARLLEDIAKGQFDVVAMAYEAQGMREYCERFNTIYEVIDVRATLPAINMKRGRMSL